MSTPNTTPRSWHDQHVLPYLLDFACDLPFIQSQRRKVVSTDSGRLSHGPRPWATTIGAWRRWLESP